MDRMTATIDFNGRTIIVDVVDDEGTLGYPGMSYIDELIDDELVPLAGTSSDNPACTLGTMFDYWTDSDNLAAEGV